MGAGRTGKPSGHTGQVPGERTSQRGRKRARRLRSPEGRRLERWKVGRNQDWNGTSEKHPLRVGGRNRETGPVAPGWGVGGGGSLSHKALGQRTPTSGPSFLKTS